MADCIFCRIAEGAIPSAKVYEDNLIVAFLDISPVAAGHVLVIPKRHSPDIIGMADEDCMALGRVLKTLAPAVMAAAGANAYNILNNRGAVAGQAVEHVHFHIIPRKEGDGRGYRWLTISKSDARIDEMAARIREQLKQLPPSR